MVTVVDAADYEMLAQFTWEAFKGRSTYYARRRLHPTSRVHQERIRMHRQILSVPDSILVDHVNFNGLDNRRQNLRSASRSQNCAHHRRAPGRSGYRGVYPSKKRWVARISLNGKARNIGSFVNPIEAARAYDIAVISLYGEFATLNFPGGKD